MTQLDDENIKQWGLTFADKLTMSMKLTINLKEFLTQEMTYSQFIDSHETPKWISLGNETEFNMPVVTMITYPCITLSTSHFFSNSVQPELVLNKDVLTFSEQFFARHISKMVMDSFKELNFGISFVRDEDRLHLVHPFQENESITMYKFKWFISQDEIGEVMVCHSNML